MAEKAGLGSLDEAKAAAQDVLRSIAQVVDGATRDGLRRRLPPELAAALEGVEGAGDPLVDREVFVGRMVGRFDTMHLYDETLGGIDLVSAYADDDASARTRAVFAALRETVDEATLAAVERALPPEIADWFRAASP